MIKSRAVSKYCITHLINSKFSIYLPLFLINPVSARTAVQSSQRKHSACQLLFIALITRPITNSPIRDNKVGIGIRGYKATNILSSLLQCNGHGLLWHKRILSKSCAVKKQKSIETLTLKNLSWDNIDYDVTIQIPALQHGVWKQVRVGAVLGRRNQTGNAVCFIQLCV